MFLATQTNSGDFGAVTAVGGLHDSDELNGSSGMDDTVHGEGRQRPRNPFRRMGVRALRSVRYRYCEGCLHFWKMFDRF